MAVISESFISYDTSFFLMPSKSVYKHPSASTCFVGVDIGSQSVKTCAVNTEGQVLASSSYSYGISYPKSGWAEEDATLWWIGIKKTLSNVLKQVKADDVCAVAFSGQAPTIIPIDKEGTPLSPAIIWTDNRSTEECKIIEETVGEKRVFATSGNRIDPYFGGGKILWYKRNRPKLFGKTWRILQSHSYPIFKLTNQTVTDYSTAGLCSPFYDYSKKDWSHELCRDLGIDYELLPQINSSSAIAGEVTGNAADETGLKKGTPVIVGGADYASSALSVGVVEEGDAAITLGTACNFIISMASPKYDERLLSTSHVVKDTYLAGGSSYAGGTLRWLRDQIFDLEAGFLKDTDVSLYEIMDNKASNIPVGSENLIAFPYLVGGLAPIWDPYARGIYFGLTPKHSKAHLYRAVLEAAGYSFLYTCSIVESKGIRPKMIYGVNGGTRSRLWRQILSDILGIPIAHIQENVGAPVGDVILAGVGVGQFKDEKIAKDWANVCETNYPNIENSIKYKKYFNIYQELYEKTKDLFASL